MNVQSLTPGLFLNKSSNRTPVSTSGLESGHQPTNRDIPPKIGDAISGWGTESSRDTNYSASRNKNRMEKVKDWLGNLPPEQVGQRGETLVRLSKKLTNVGMRFEQEGNELSLTPETIGQACRILMRHTLPGYAGSLPKDEPSYNLPKNLQGLNGNQQDALISVEDRLATIKNLAQCLRKTHYIAKVSYLRILLEGNIKVISAKLKPAQKQELSAFLENLRRNPNSDLTKEFNKKIAGFLGKMERLLQPPSQRSAGSGMAMQLRQQLPPQIAGDPGFGNLFEERNADSLREISAKKIQRAWRNHQIRQENRKLNSDGVHEIRDSKNGIVGYTDPKETAPRPEERSTLAIWPKMGEEHRDPSINPRLQGAAKKLTHRHTNSAYVDRYGGHVGLTTHSKELDKKPDETFKQPAEVLKKILELNLSHVVVQREVERGFYVARQLEEDLWERANKVPIPFLGFKPFLKNLKTLHENDLTHRDIKLENLMALKNEAYLTDLDTMGFVDRLEPKKAVPGTPECHDAKLYWHLHTINMRDRIAGAKEQGKYAKVMDNYAALLTLIQNQEGGIDLKRAYPHQDVRLSGFVYEAKAVMQSWTSLYVKPEHVNDVDEILRDPKSYSEKYNGNPPHLYDMLKFD